VFLENRTPTPPSSFDPPSSFPLPCSPQHPKPQLPKTLQPREREEGERRRRAATVGEARVEPQAPTPCPFSSSPFSALIPENPNPETRLKLAREKERGRENTGGGRRQQAPAGVVLCQRANSGNRGGSSSGS